MKASKPEGENMKKLYRQGDVLFVPARVPKGAVARDKSQDNAARLVEGEATGHHHSVTTMETTEVLDCGEGLYLRIGGDGVSIVHQEHAPVMLPAGSYEVRRQREYSPEEIRNVAD